MTRKIAILGLGAMGSRMAERLLAAGHEVTVYNRTPERAAPLVDAGARFADTPRSAAAGAEIVIGMVRDDEASKSIWLDRKTGALGALGKGSIAVESSTLTPGWVRALADAVAKQGAAFLDAPVAGSRPQAEAGQLIYLVGGDPSALGRVRGVFLEMGGAVHHVGPTGAGSVMKLAVNALFAIQAAALGEVLGMTRRAGMSDADVVEALSSIPVTSPAMKGVGSLIAARKFDPMFPIELVEKDLSYFVATASALDSDVPTGSAVAAVYRRAIEEGFGGDNIAGIAQLFD